MHWVGRTHYWWRAISKIPFKTLGKLGRCAYELHYQPALVLREDMVRPPGHGLGAGLDEFVNHGRVTTTIGHGEFHQIFAIGLKTVVYLLPAGGVAIRQNPIPNRRRFAPPKRQSAPCRLAGDS